MKLKVMFNFFLIVIGTIFSQCISSQVISNLSTEDDKLKIDTLILKDIVFESDLSFIIESCLDKAYETKSLTKKDVKYLKNLFNKELDTKVFNQIGVATGKILRFTEYKRWVRVVELHFESEDITDTVEYHLGKLDQGIIRRTIYPNRCDFVRKEKKIYLLQYSPIVSGKLLWKDDLLRCMN
ncbi:MAG: hypothetical protein AB8G15_00415 [Saprospiraceae bacterium]